MGLLLASLVVCAGTLPGLATVASATTPATASATTPATASAATGGGWHITAGDPGHWEVTWTSPTPLPLVDDRPQVRAAGFEVGAAGVDPDGVTVRAALTGRTAPTPAALDVVLSGDRLDEPGNDVADRVAASVSPSTAGAARSTAVTTPDPGVAGPFAVVDSDVQAAPIALPGLPTLVEMVAHVVEPVPGAATGPRPVVLFLHGRHGVCYDPDDPGAFTRDWPCVAPFREIPSQLGYEDTQRTLASQGYYTISIRANGINAQDARLPDAGASARAALVRAHLDRLVPQATAHRLDLSRVVLVGHSRGGEGVDRAAIEIPLSAPYRVVGQALIAPTDFGGQAAAYVPTVTLLPYCDGDVADLQGQQFTDNGRDVARDDTSLKSSVLVMGANHNFFNSVWTPSSGYGGAFDDWFGPATGPCGRKTPARLTAAEQRRVGTAYVAGAVHLFTGRDASGTPGGAYLPLYDGTATSVPSTGDAVVLSHALGGGRATRRPGADASLSLATGGARTSLCRGLAVGFFGGGGVKPSDCGWGLDGVVAPLWGTSTTGPVLRSFLQLAWTRAGAVGGLRFDRSPLDLRTDRLELRTIVDPAVGDVRLRVRLTDAAGRTAVVAPVGGTSLPALLAGRQPVTKLWAQALVVRPTASTGLDLSRVVAVELVADSAAGRVWVGDVSAAPAALAPVPTKRLATLSVGVARVQEGDDPGEHVARVPFTVSGDVTAPARVVVQVLSFGRSGARDRFVLDVAPGQRRGTIPVSYTSDTVWGGSPTARTYVVAYLQQGLATDDYIGALDVVEDDPRPVFTVTPVAATVAEGQPARFRITSSIALNEPVSVYPLVVLARGVPNLQGSDVPIAWLRAHTFEPPSDLGQPLASLALDLQTALPPGATSADVTVPTRVDGVTEGPETVAIRFYVGADRPVTSSITVVSSD